MTARVYFDSNILIELCESGSDAPTVLPSLFRMFEAQPDAAVTSLVTLGEVLGRKSPHMTWSDQKALYSGLLVGSAFIEVIPVDETVFLEAADQRHAARHEGRILRLADAIHIASASLTSCKYFVTEDVRLAKCLPSNIRSLASSVSGIDMVRQALGA